MFKYILSTLLLVLLSLSLFGHAPQAMQYQTVVRDASGNLLRNANISIRMIIKQGSASGTIVYQETHKVGSNAYGLVNLEIGNGVVESGTFPGIDWGNGPFFINVWLDVNGGTNYVE